MKYTYFIDFNDGSGNVAFIPDKDAVYEWKSEKQYDGFMRKAVKGIALSRDYNNADGFPNATVFNTLWEYFFDITKHTTEIKLQIFKDTVLDFESLFYITDGDIDVNNGGYTIKPIPDDNYRILLEVMDKEVDLITNLGTDISAQYTYTAIQDDGYDNGSGTESPYVTDDEVPDAWELGYGSGCTTWYRQISLYDLGGGWVKSGNLWYKGITRSCDNAHGDNPATKVFTYPNCYNLVTSIQLILTTILEGTDMAGMTFSSLFFNNATNYVTGEANKLMNTLIEQRSDTKDPDATNKATEGKISMNDLMKDLQAMFDVMWYVDDAGDFRIEHRKFFYNGLKISGNKTVGIDLTSDSKYLDPYSDKLYIEDTQKFSGQAERPIKSESIKFTDQETYEWWDSIYHLDYDVIDYEQAKKEHNVTKFSTDISKAINNPDAIEDEGFFMFNCEPESGGTAEIIARERDYTNPLTQSYPNAGFSVKWLLHDYYEYGRSNKSGVLAMTTGSTTPSAYSVIASLPIYIQKDIIFLLNDDDSININEYIATYLVKYDGSKDTVNGNIVKIEHDLYDDYIKVSLGFEL